MESDTDSDVTVMTCHVPKPPTSRTLHAPRLALLVLLGWLAAAGIAVFFDFPWS